MPPPCCSARRENRSSAGWGGGGGHKNDPGVDILSVVNKYDVDIDFPQAVYDEIESIPQSIDPSDILIV